MTHLDRRKFLHTAGGAAAALALSGPLRALPPPPTGPRKVFRTAYLVAETGFDPQVFNDQYSNNIMANIFESPLRYAYLARPARLVPMTAAEMPQVADDFKTFTVRIRPGILFDDHPAFGGKPRELVAEDYVYSLKRIFDPRWKSQKLFIYEPLGIVGLGELRKRALRPGGRFDYDTPVEGLRTLDRYTFQVRLAQPAPRFLYNLASPA
ncbi:MAG: twin-arginine translocation signal domain-containing protein, partial [Betaproteobacteria bacterium]|nr:twin-arginine translocation signal domain-containing protein [Betaproteobacteria bacterium]